MIPVPCHPDSLAMAYALKFNDRVVPLKLFATNHSPSSSMSSLQDLLCCLPAVQVPEGMGYKNLFRVIIMQFIDAHAFDVRSVKKSCVHIVHPKDGRLIPFDTYNLFYRDDLERTRLAPLRAQQDAWRNMVGV